MDLNYDINHLPIPSEGDQTFEGGKLGSFSEGRCASFNGANALDDKKGSSFSLSTVPGGYTNN